MDLLKKSTFSRSLFKKQKADPEFLAGQGKVRLSLLKNLARAIKEVQLLYATREGGTPIGDCRATQRLCSRFEAVLRHGLKAGWFGQGGSYWPLVLRISRKQAIEYISSLQYAQSDNGRCRAWIRLAVNECSLESYISVLCQDTALLGQYYESYSFVHDGEMVEAMRQLLTGLTQLEFSITVDTASLEFEAAPEALQPALRLRPPEHLHKARGKRHRSPRTIPQEHKKGSAVVEDSNSDWSSCEEEVEEGSGNGTQVEEESGNETQATSSVSAGSAMEGNKPWEQEGEQQASSGEPQAVHHQWCGQDGGQDGGYKVGGGWDQQLEDPFMGGEWDEEPEAEDRKDEVLERQDERVQVEGEPSGRPDSGDRSLDTKKQEERASVSDESVSKSDKQDEIPEMKDEPGLWSEVQEKQDLGVEANAKQDEMLRKEDDPTERQGTRGEEDNPTERQGTRGEVEDATMFGDDSWGTGAEGSDTAPETDGGGGVWREGQERYSPSPDLLEPPASPKVEDGCEDSTAVESSSWQSNGPLELYVEEDRTSGPEPILAPVLFQESSDGISKEVQCHVQVPGPSEDLQFTTPPSTPPFFPPSPPPPPPPATSSTPPPLYVGPPSPVQSHDRYSPTEGSSPKYGDSTPSSQDYEQLSHASSLEWLVVLEETLGRPHPQEGGPVGLQLQEDYYAEEKSPVDLQRSIERLKKELSSLPVDEEGKEEKHEKRKRIVQLQLRLQRMKEESLGHQFVRQPRQSPVESGVVCESCGKSVKGLLRSWYKCQKCSCVTHKACLAKVSQRCMPTKEELSYELRVCPEQGLTYQNFRCALCNRAFTPTPQPVEARLCDYSGLYYCPNCHHNDLAVIPARVLHNWDFSLRKVSSHSATLLERLASHPLLRIQQVNPLLYTYVQDLVTIESLRHDILLMKEYFVQCREALEAHLLQKLDHFSHFKDTAQLFSLRDLEEAHSGRLLPQLQEIHRLYAHHIMHECLVCSGKGYYCELCGSEDVLYPFDRHASLCSACHSVFHKTCFTEMASCPKCARTQR